MIRNKRYLFGLIKGQHICVVNPWMNYLFVFFFDEFYRLLFPLGYHMLTDIERDY